MADTMTLEQVREEMLPHVDGTDTHTKVPVVKMQGWADSIDAAIRERDRLRGDVSGMTEELLHVPSREEWRALQKRAERAEAELAALKARIAEAPTAIVGRCALNSSPEYNIVTACSPLDGKRVRLVVEE